MAERELEILVDGNVVAIIGDIRDDTDRNILRDQCLSVITRKQKPVELVLDFSRTKYVDARALMTVFSIARRASEIGVPHRLEGLNTDQQKLVHDTVGATLSTLNDRARRRTP